MSRTNHDFPAGSWLDQLPTGWCPVRLKWLVTRNEGGVWGEDTNGDGTVVLRSTEVNADGSWKIDDPARRRLTEREKGNSRLVAGDLVVTKSSGSPEHLGKTALVTSEIEALGCAFSNFMQRLRPGPDLEPRYAAYLLNSKIGSDQMVYLGVTTTGLRNLSGSLLGDLVVPGATLQEQSAIADFLDDRTQALADLLAKKERLKALVGEKREAAIAQIVTKGLNGRVEYTDSGVHWIGEAPAHWEVVRTRFVARLESGHTPSRQHPEYWIPEECTVPWFTLADVWQLRGDRQEYLGDTTEMVSPLGLANSSARILPAGTVVLSRTASVGFSGIMPHPMATSQDFVNWVCGPRIRPEYLLYVFRAMRSEFRRLIMGSTHQTIYMPDVRNFRTPLPPLEEQDAIVSAIRDETSRYHELVVKLRRQIAALREYRQTLISAAVTGQVDVRAHELEAVPI